MWHVRPINTSSPDDEPLRELDLFGMNFCDRAGWTPSCLYGAHDMCTVAAQPCSNTSCMTGYGCAGCGSGTGIGDVCNTCSLDWGPRYGGPCLGCVAEVGVDGPGPCICGFDGVGWGDWPI